MAQMGWIRLDRKILEHYLWQDKPFSKGQAWIDLLLMASHDEHKFLHGAKCKTIRPGEIITSELKLSERWGWSRQKTRDFLDLLQSDEMITKNSTTKGTTLTIVKWGDFQLLGTTNNTTDNTAKKQQKNTYKNVNNYNKYNSSGSTPENIITFSGISAEQKAELISKYGATAVNDKLERIKQYKVKDVYLTLCKWLQEDSTKTKKQKNGFNNLDQREIGADQMAEIEKELLRH